MEIEIKKWGNSLGVRIPKIIAKDLKITEGTLATIEDIDGQIVISPEKNRLQNILKQINAENIHSEIDFGMQKGQESW